MSGAGDHSTTNDAANRCGPSTTFFDPSSAVRTLFAASFVVNSGEEDENGLGRASTANSFAAAL